LVLGVDEPPRAARVVYLNSAAGVGGGEKWMLALADGLDPARYASAFVVTGEGRFADEARRRGHPVTVIGLARLVSARSLVALVRHFRQARPDLVHTAGARASFYGRLAAWLAGVPAVISSVHTSIGDYEVAGWRRRLYLALDRLTARIAHRLIATSETVAADLVARGQAPRSRVATIPNRPDPRDLAPTRPRAAVRWELGAADGEVLLGVVARLAEQKGVADFLDASAQLAGRAGWRAVIVGDGPERAALEVRARRLGLAGRCGFAGTRTDLGDLLAAFDLLVVPSRSEGLPYLVLEAMVAGTPLVATAVGGIPEVVVDGVHATLVPPRAPARLAGAIAGCLDDPARARGRADAARRHAAETLSLTVMLEAVDGVYAAVLAEAGVCPPGSPVMAE
jgi:glycosyltransferase involved in cell wall biosynthesis